MVARATPSPRRLDRAPRTRPPGTHRRGADAAKRHVRDVARRVSGPATRDHPGRCWVRHAIGIANWDRLITDRRDRRIFNRGSYWYCHAPDGYCANTELLTYTTHDITCRTVPAQHNDKQKKYYDTTERSTGTGTCEGAFRRDDGA